MKTSTILLKIAGIVNFIFFIFHIPFYWMFNWENTLAVLDANNRNILLTFNIVSICLLLYFTVVLLRYTHVISGNALGEIFLSLVSLFYIIRIFAEFYFWGIHGFTSVIILTLCAIPVICCVIPLILSKKSAQCQAS